LQASLAIKTQKIYKAFLKKSKSLKAMLNLIPISSGKISFFGKPYKEFRKDISYVPQSESVDWDFPTDVLDVVMMGTYGKLGWIKRAGKKERELSLEALKKLGMEEFVDRQISDLSGGQQQRVFLARALVQDSEIYRDLSFDFLFLDEAQVMKNAQTKIAQSLRRFVVPSVFALSGTPIENHLGELWSIFQIVMPGLLPSKKEFMKLPAERVAQFIKPFVMRRKKEEVLTELPDLIDVVYKNELEDQQKAIYLAQLQQMRDRLAQVSDQEFQRSRVEILSGLMRLRQICDTPALFMEDYHGESGKLESLLELLEQIQTGSHRVLIFSQFRGMLDIIEKELKKMKMETFKITGSTPAKERQEMTNAFNNGEGDAFLISLKAGGVGLNLTGADTVILVDLWWNPAVESQAIGRAHRMGQERNVEVYRLITRGTIEEKSSGKWSQFVVETVDKMEKPIAHVIPEVLANVIIPIVIVVIIIISIKIIFVSIIIVIITITVTVTIWIKIILILICFIFSFI